MSMAMHIVLGKVRAELAAEDSLEVISNDKAITRKALLLYSCILLGVDVCLMFCGQMHWLIFQSLILLLKSL